MGSDLATHPLVLIADDDRVTRAMLDSWLTGSGYGVVEARDGEEALRLAGQRGPDLVLVDVVMPGIDGYEVCREIRARGESAPPVIFITSHDWAGGSAMGLEAGAVDYIVKPFGRDELIACVGVALGLTRPMGQDALDAGPRPLVLIADDDGVTCARVGAWLAGSGYEIAVARDGVEALRIAGELGPDLLLLDVIMPGLDGFEVCRELQSRSGAPPPVVFITAHDETGRRVIALDAGAVEYMLKPFQQEELVACVRGALRKQSVPDDPRRHG